MTDKWGSRPSSPTVAFFAERAGSLVQARLAESGKTWEQAVFDPELALTQAEFAAIEAELLATGHRFDFSARISVDEAPEKYKAPDVGGGTVTTEYDEQGRALVGSGDNVFRADDVTGTARIVSDIETVLDMLTNGVPENTVAIIDDSGGTLTAPILEGFTAVICKGGTIRSHLGILTREYRIPCLMAASVEGISDGDTVLVEYSTEAFDPYAAEGAPGSAHARIWKLK
jgi:phosphohistidine swiveling domain-containing protein